MARSAACRIASASPCSADTAATPTVAPTLRSFWLHVTGSVMRPMTAWARRSQRLALVAERDQHGELVAAQPGRQAARRHELLEALGHGAQDRVPGRVAVEVVDRLEPVEVDEQHRRVPGARRVRPLHGVDEAAAVRQTGQPVVPRDRLGLRRRGGALEHEPPEDDRLADAGAPLRHAHAGGEQEEIREVVGGDQGVEIRERPQRDADEPDPDADHEQAQGLVQLATAPSFRRLDRHGQDPVSSVSAKHAVRSCAVKQPPDAGAYLHRYVTLSWFNLN